MYITIWWQSQNVPFLQNFQHKLKLKFHIFVIWKYPNGNQSMDKTERLRKMANITFTGVILQKTLSSINAQNQLPNHSTELMSCYFRLEWACSMLHFESIDSSDYLNERWIPDKMWASPWNHRCPWVARPDRRKSTAK